MGNRVPPVSFGPEEWPNIVAVVTYPATSLIDIHSILLYLTLF